MMNPIKRIQWNDIYPAISFGTIAELQSCEDSALDILNVFFKVAIDQNVVLLYRIFLGSEKPDRSKARGLVNNLIARYNPEL